MKTLLFFLGVELLMAKVPCYDRFDQENQTTRSEPSVQKDYSDSRGGSSPPSDCSQTTTDMFYATKEDLAETLVRRRRRRPNKQHWKLFRLNEFLAKTQQGVMEQKLLLDGNVEKGKCRVFATVGNACQHTRANTLGYFDVRAVCFIVFIS